MALFEDFLEAFGQLQDSDTSYMYRDQKQVVRDYNNIGNQNSEKGQDSQSDDYQLKGEDPQTGEKFSLDLKKENGKPKNRHEEEWIKREMTVTFTSLNNKDKFVSATLGSLCGGKYAHLVDKSIEEIASTLSQDVNSIFNYAYSSIANYSDRITSEQAFRISKSIAENNKISYFDYEKICAKLNTDHVDGFNSMLRSSNIKIAYPMQVLEKEMKEAKDKIEITKIAAAKADKDKRVSYYVDLFKSFKEYRLSDTGSLQKRIASALPLLSDDIKESVIEELRKDAIIRDII